ncbi:MULTISPECIES: DNA alkylation repair protein [unclassified Sphingopyxis]|uniref:DNA alkylation repair protein n=1 Tax=unclassified Sphingopyxis TaxID=2614943 RepID=UPI00285F4344|nr:MULTISPECIES: DNA alkylation repair protein [unclassified Sphingopyxis]MDR7059450.1 3-methyladenine DNA glycosylase AlkC [Sphingopyxis sp. BE235]MDR7181038.1 3-methyladenine DNA glycosylase AlkC [Sphingopyxis sp. BE249]
MTQETPALLKDILGPQALQTIGDAGVTASRHFDRAAFLSAASDGLDALSIMERVRHIADALRAALPGDYPAALDVVRAMAPRFTHGFQAMAVTEYVARYGLDDFDRSMDALADLTRFGTAEFAIRPFLAADTPRALAVMMRWASSEDEHVRRLASEGARPRLPWAARVPALKADPTLAAPILEMLKADPSLYVRKSVANHLNDIAKDRPDWLLDRLAEWPQDDARTVWIVRHALRTLIKKGDPAALALIGVGHGAAVSVRDFSIAPPAVHLGDRIAITASLASDSSENQRLVVDYRVHYARAGGKSAAKVFKLKSFELAAGESVPLGISQTIRDFTTRRHYPGRHEVELIVNGQVMATAAFDILPAD